MMRILAGALCALVLMAAADAAPKAFAGAEGWAATTPGGRDGRIIRVTTLKADGPGSFLAAIHAKGPRIVIFEVGGVIDLGRREIRIDEPFLTIAGQTAPSPGITFIKGGLQIATHDVIVRHIRVRMGEAGAAKTSGWEADGISTFAAHDVIIDHCSIAWATDEGGSASGPRFDGATPAEWRAHTSHRISFTNNIYAEGLSHATHAKGEHSKGSLIHDNTADILVAHNLYIHNMQRHPLIKGGARVVVAGNLIVDPGSRVMRYILNPTEWGDIPYQSAIVTVVGNVVHGGASTDPEVPMFGLSGRGTLMLYLDDNVALRKDGAAMPRLGRFANADATAIELSAPMIWPPHFVAPKASETEASVLANAGARPWDRDAIDARLIEEARTNTGRIIDSETEAGGYPIMAETHAPFVAAEWNLADMTRKPKASGPTH